MTRSAPPSGKQFRLQSGDSTAVVTEVGAGLRSYTVGGVELLDGYGIDQMCSDARGHTFIPWPNRIADGRYRFGGEEHQLPLTEPDKHNAIHGLTRWANWHVADPASANHGSVRLQHVLHPQPGYPFQLRCEIAYQLGSAGLRVETRTTNVGAAPCPYATGAHPYLTLGTELVDDLTVELPAALYYRTDERGIPVDRCPVDGTEFDLRTPTRLGSRVVDNAFTDLKPGADGGTTVTVSAPDGRAVELWMDAGYRYVELFTGDSVPERARRRKGLGVEPMTAAPDAFRTGDGLLTLQPGETHSAAWELRPCAR
jgi:aldose 1-epimerase